MPIIPISHRVLRTKSYCEIINDVTGRHKIFNFLPEKYYDKMFKFVVIGIIILFHELSFLYQQYYVSNQGLEGLKKVNEGG